MFLEILLAILLIILVLAYLISPFYTPKTLDIAGKHVLITGGSSGIGKELAIQAVKRGANVTLLARNKAKLSEAQEEVEAHIIMGDSQKVYTVSVDLSADCEAVERAVQDAEQRQGPVTMLVNSAGLAINGVFEDIPIADFRKAINVNYLGSVYATRAVIRGMKSRKEGRVVFLSSQAGQVGVYGFTAYSPTKFALRGLAEALQMEVKPYNIRVTVVYPPDTDTPGLAEEMQTKPKETRLISESAGLFQPDYVANVIMKDSLSGKYQCYIGMDGWMMCQVTAGMAPVTSIMEGVQQALLSGLLRAVSLVYLAYFDRIVQKCKREREEEAANK